MLWSFEKCPTLKLKKKNLALLKPIVIICLTRHLWCHVAAKFGVFVDEQHGELSTLYWLT